MAEVRRINPASSVFDIYGNWRIQTREQKPGPPDRIDGMTVGIISMSASAPHGGEVHPDGDELLYVISGRLAVHADSAPEQPVLLQAGEGCIVPAGEWHRVEILEPTQLLYMTPGPNGDHRPL